MQAHNQLVEQALGSGGMPFFIDDAANLFQLSGSFVDTGADGQISFAFTSTELDRTIDNGIIEFSDNTDVDPVIFGQYVLNVIKRVQA